MLQANIQVQLLNQLVLVAGQEHILTKVQVKPAQQDVQLVLQANIQVQLLNQVVLVAGQEHILIKV